MDTDFQTLIVLAEVLVAFVAFSAIVASIRLTVGEELTPFQRLLIHFFIEGGMVAAFIALLPMVLWSFVPDERLVTQISGAISIVVISSYLGWYLKRRSVIDAATPITSVAIVLTWFLWIPVFGAVVVGLLWEPTFAILEATAFLGLISGAVVFGTFLKTFLDPREDH
jgi:hypothetical protein